MTHNLPDVLIVLVFVTGSAIWLLIALFTAAFVVFGVIPWLVREACFIGYVAFGEKAEKQARREAARLSLQQGTSNG